MLLIIDLPSPSPARSKREHNEQCGISCIEQIPKILTERRSETHQRARREGERVITLSSRAPGRGADCRGGKKVIRLRHETYTEELFGSRSDNSQSGYLGQLCNKHPIISMSRMSRRSSRPTFVRMSPAVVPVKFGSADRFRISVTRVHHRLLRITDLHQYPSGRPPRIYQI